MSGTGRLILEPDLLMCLNRPETKMLQQAGGVSYDAAPFLSVFVPSTNAGSLVPVHLPSVF